MTSEVTEANKEIAMISVKLVILLNITNIERDIRSTDKET
jgi:hypothetical protein